MNFKPRFYEFISGPFDGGWCERDYNGIKIGLEIIQAIASECGKTINLEGNIIMPGEMRIKFNKKYAEYVISTSDKREYNFRGYVNGSEGEGEGEGEGKKVIN